MIDGTDYIYCVIYSRFHEISIGLCGFFCLNVENKIQSFVITGFRDVNAVSVDGLLTLFSVGGIRIVRRLNGICRNLFTWLQFGLVAFDLVLFVEDPFYEWELVTVGVVVMTFQMQQVFSQFDQFCLFSSSDKG